MDERERSQKLEEAVRDAVASRKDDAPVVACDRSRGRRQGVLVAILMLTWAAIAYIWLARPAFVFGPTAVAVQPPAVREASLRFALYLERRRIDAYTAANGRLPASLADAGPVESGVTFERNDAGYVLVGHRDDLTLTLTSAMNADSFLGSSLDHLQGAPEPAQ